MALPAIGSLFFTVGSKLGPGGFASLESGINLTKQFIGAIAGVIAESDKFGRAMRRVDMNIVTYADSAAKGQVDTLKLMEKLNALNKAGINISKEGMASITKAATDMALATGGDATQEMVKLTEAVIKGSKEALLPYGIVLKETKSKTEDQSNAIKALTGRFKDLDLEVNDASGGMTHLKNSWGTLVDAWMSNNVIGEAISNVFHKIANGLDAVTDSIVNQLSELEKAEKAVANYDKSVAAAAKEMSLFERVMLNVYNVRGGPILPGVSMVDSSLERLRKERIAALEKERIAKELEAFGQPENMTIFDPEIAAKHIYRPNNNKLTGAEAAPTRDWQTDPNVSWSFDTYEREARQREMIETRTALFESQYKKAADEVSAIFNSLNKPLWAYQQQVQRELEKYTRDKDIATRKAMEALEAEDDIEAAKQKQRADRAEARYNQAYTDAIKSDRLDLPPLTKLIAYTETILKNSEMTEKLKAFERGDYTAEDFKREFKDFLAEAQKIPALEKAVPFLNQFYRGTLLNYYDEKDARYKTPREYVLDLQRKGEYADSIARASGLDPTAERLKEDNKKRAMLGIPSYYEEAYIIKQQEEERKLSEYLSQLKMWDEDPKNKKTKEELLVIEEERRKNANELSITEQKRIEALQEEYALQEALIKAEEARVASETKRLEALQKSVTLSREERQAERDKEEQRRLAANLPSYAQERDFIQLSSVESRRGYLEELESLYGRDGELERRNELEENYRESQGMINAEKERELLLIKATIDAHKQLGEAITVSQAKDIIATQQRIQGLQDTVEWLSVSSQSMSMFGDVALDAAELFGASQKQMLIASATMNMVISIIEAAKETAEAIKAGAARQYAEMALHIAAAAAYTATAAIAGAQIAKAGGSTTTSPQSFAGPSIPSGYSNSGYSGGYDRGKDTQEINVTITLDQAAKDYGFIVERNNRAARAGKPHFAVVGN
jgi:hypothetical protein